MLLNFLNFFKFGGLEYISNTPHNVGLQPPNPRWLRTRTPLLCIVIDESDRHRVMHGLYLRDKVDGTLKSIASASRLLRLQYEPICVPNSRTNQLSFNSVYNVNRRTAIRLAKYN